MDALLKIAVQEIGVKEIAGPEHNPTILNYSKEAGFSWINDDETPWCSIFINWCAIKAKIKGSGKESARSWLLIGEKVETPLPGDVVVFWRESIDSWKGHVGIFFGFNQNGKRVYCLGGNQGNMVSITSYDTREVLGYRRLYPISILELPNKELKFGDSGEEVKQLQMALTALGFDCGLADGIYGKLTQSAVKKLQSTLLNLPITGVFDSETRRYLSDIQKA